MKILYFSTRYSVHDYNFLKKMGESRHTIYFLPLETHNLFDEKKPVPHGIQVLQWQEKHDPVISPKRAVSYIHEFEQIISDIDPDLIHAGPVQTCGYMTALSEFHPFLLMSWGSDILRDADINQELFRITKYTLRHSDWIFVDNMAIRRKIQSIIPYADERILEFPWGVDIDRFKKIKEQSEIRRRKGWDGCHVILSTRMWEPIYGIPDLLEGFYLAYQENQNIRLILLGDGSLAPEVRKYIGEKNIAGLIHMPGIIDHDELPEYFNAADFYLSCSFSDGSSISLLEAMASGLPSIVTNIPGNVQWIEDRKNGWLVSPGNPKDIARGISSAINEQGLILDEISQYNIELIQKKADWNKNFQKLLDLYDRIENQCV